MGLFGGSNDAVTKIKIAYDGKDAERGLNALKTTVGTLVSAYALKQLAQYTWEIGNLGAQTQMVEKNFESFAKTRNRSVDSMMSKMRSATMGMVDDLQLQQKAMQAMVGGVKFDDLVVAMEYVTKFASATGQDVNVKMQSTMTGLARKSAQFLDDIGIQVMGSKDVVGDAIDQMKEKMGQFATSEDDVSVNARVLTADFENMKQNISTLLVPAFSKLIDVINDSAVGWSYLLGLNKRNDEAAKAQAENIVRLSTEYQDLNANIKAAESDGRNMVTWLSEGNFRTEKLGVAKAELKAIKEQIIGINSASAGSKGPPTEPNAPAGLSEEDATKLEKIQANAREAVLKQSLDGRLQLLEENWKKEKALAISAGESTKFMDQNYYNQREQELGKFHQQVAEMTAKKDEEETRAIIEQRKKEADEKEQLLKDSEAILNDILSQSAEGRKQLLIKEYNENYQILQKAGIDVIGLNEWLQNELTKIDEDESKKRIDNYNKEKQAKINASNEFINSVSLIYSAASSLSDAYTQKELRNLDAQFAASQKQKKRLTRQEQEYENEKAKIMQEAGVRSRIFARMQQGIVIARAISDTLAAGVGSAKDTPGGAISRGIAMGATIAAGMLQVAQIQAQNFQRGFLGETDRLRRPDDINAQIGRNEAVIPGPQYAMHEDDVKAIVNNTANTAAGMRKLKGGSTVNNFYGLSETQVANVIKDQERRNYTGRLL